MKTLGYSQSSGSKSIWHTAGSMQWDKSQMRADEKPQSRDWQGLKLLQSWKKEKPQNPGQNFVTQAPQVIGTDGRECCQPLPMTNTDAKLLELSR